MSINIIIHCQNLNDRDIISVSDPRCRVTLVDTRDQRSIKTLGFTETIKNNVNPKFKNRIRIPNQYFQGSGYLFKFTIEDVDSHKKNDNIGSCIIAPYDITNSGAHGVSRKLDGDGRITVFLDDQTQGSVSFIFRGIKIASMDFIGKSDPYFEIYQDNMSLYKSEHIDNTKNPKWAGFDIGMNRIKMDKEVTVRVFDYDGPHMHADFIGECSFTPANIQNSGREMPLLSGKGKCKGYLCVDQCQILKAKPATMNTTNFPLQPAFNRSKTGIINPYPTMPPNQIYPGLQHQNSVNMAPHFQHHNSVATAPHFQPQNNNVPAFQHHNSVAHHIQPGHHIPNFNHHRQLMPQFSRTHTSPDFHQPQASAPPPFAQNTPYTNPHLYANPNMPSAPYPNPMNPYPNQQFPY